MLVHKLYENSNGEKLYIQYIYMADEDIIISHFANLIDSEGNIKEYSKEVNVDIKADSMSNRPTFPSWLCYLSSFAACTIYCSGLALITPGIGLACSLVCGGLFHAACNGIK